MPKIKLIDMCSCKQDETAIQSYPRRYQPAMVGNQSVETSSAECATAKKSRDKPIPECAKSKQKQIEPETLCVAPWQPSLIESEKNRPSVEIDHPGHGQLESQSVAIQDHKPCVPQPPILPKTITKNIHPYKFAKLKN